MIQADAPQLYLTVDEAKALAMGVAISDVYDTLGFFMGGKYVNDFTRIGKIFRVIIQADAPYRMTPESLGELYVRSDTGKMVPLSTLAHVERTSGPESLKRENGFLAASMNVNAAQGYSTGDVIRAVDAELRYGGSLALQQVLELAVLRDDLIASLKNTEAAKEAYPLRSIVEANIGDVGRFAEVLNSMPAVRQKRVYATLPAIFGEDWPQKALELFDAGGARAVGEIAKFLIEEGQDKVLVKHLKHELLRQTLPAESLIWICRQRHDASKPLFGLPVGIAMLSLIEQDHMDGGPNRMLRLKNLFMEDKSIIQEMIKGQDVAEVRQFAKMLYNTSAFSEQDRGALMARIISVFPDLHAIVLDALVDNSDKPEPIFVSWESLEARKKELEELVNVKIPENLHNKKISRAEGDLRENGGYQDAKEVEKVLNRRRAELEHALALARGTDFAVTDTSRAAMGTKVTLQPLNGGEPVVYTILGAWDTNPEKHIVSYLSQVGKELTGKSVGDQVKIVPMDGDKKKVYTITKIEAAF